MLSNNNTFTGSNTFSNDTTGIIINRLFTNILAINNNNSRRSVNDIFEVATSSTGNYIYYNNSSTFGFINTSNSALSWFINSSGAATIPSITTPTAYILNGSITNLYSNILSINNSTALRSANDLFNVSISSTGNYLYYNSSSVFGHINTSNSALSWSINNGSASFPSLTSGVSSISSLAVNSSSVRGSGDLMTVSVSPTGNYIYLNNSSTFGHINTSNSDLSWFINQNGSANFPSLNVNGLSSTSSLAVNSSSIRGSGDLLTVSVTPSGDYLYLNNTGTLGIYRSSGNPSFFPWTIDTVGLGTFRSITTITANITTDNVGTLNVSGTSTTSKLSINSTMRSNNDLFNASSSSTGPYLFIDGDVTIGTYDTNTSSFPWFVELDGDSTFQTVNC